MSRKAKFDRLFTGHEVYKTALKNELVQLGIPPSQAREAVNTLWKDWGKKDVPEGWNVYAVLMPTGGKWTAALCCQKQSGGTALQARKINGEQID